STERLHPFLHRLDVSGFRLFPESPGSADATRDAPAEGSAAFFELAAGTVGAYNRRRTSKPRCNGVSPGQDSILRKPSEPSAIIHPLRTIRPILARNFP